MPWYFTMSLKKREEKMMNVVDFRISLVDSLIRLKLNGFPDARPVHKVILS